MSYYYKYEFTSPEPIYAIVREELKSYFDTGMVDDLMFPTYLNKRLNKLGKSSYVITQEILHIEDFESRLPDNFYGVREAWLCVDIGLWPYQTANSFYSQSATTTIQIAPVVVNGTECRCENPNCEDPDCEGRCVPEVIQGVYKTNHQVARTFRKAYLLKPGNIAVREHCDNVHYTEMWREFQPTMYGSSAHDSFDIRDNKFVTNFRYGTVYIVFYATEYDKGGSQLVPDNFRIKEYIEAYLKYKMFETIVNQVTDETFNQLMQKLQYYKQLHDEAYIIADTEIKKQTIYDKQRRIRQSLRRNLKYELPSHSDRSSWRRTT